MARIRDSLSSDLYFQLQPSIVMARYGRNSFLGGPVGFIFSYFLG